MLHVLPLHGESLRAPQANSSPNEAWEQHCLSSAIVYDALARLFIINQFSVLGIALSLEQATFNDIISLRFVLRRQITQSVKENFHSHLPVLIRHVEVPQLRVWHLDDHLASTRRMFIKRIDQSFPGLAAKKYSPQPSGALVLSDVKIKVFTATISAPSTTSVSPSSETCSWSRPLISNDQSCNSLLRCSFM
jgi:hypothetical protein